MAGAMTSVSSVPIRPPSPACGLRPATAMRGEAMPKSWVSAAAGDAHGLDDQGARQRARHGGERDVHRDRHDLQLVGHQHHDGLRSAGSAVAQRQLGQELGVAGVGQLGPVERALDDGVRHQRQRLARRHGRGRGFDGGHDRRVGAVGSRRADAHGQDRQRVRERCGRLGRTGNDGERNGEPEGARALRQHVRVGVEHEGRQTVPLPLQPAHESDIRADAGRVAHRHRDRGHAGDFRFGLVGRPGLAGRRAHGALIDIRCAHPA